MNEILFIGHILAVLGFLGLAVRYGRFTLFVFISLSAVFANLFVLKQMTLFGLQVTCSDVFAVGGILGLNLLQELYGRDTARHAIHASLIGLVLYVGMSQIHLLYQPNIFDQTQSSYQMILGQTPRIVIASLSVYYFVQRMDVIFFGFLKRLISSLTIRLILSVVVNQALDTILFSFLGLYGLVASLLDIMIVSFFIKCSMIAMSSPVVAFFKRFARKEHETLSL